MVNIEIVKIVKNTIHTVGMNSLKKTVKLDDTLCIRMDLKLALIHYSSRLLMPQLWKFHTEYT